MASRARARCVDRTLERWARDVAPSAHGAEASPLGSALGCAIGATVRVMRCTVQLARWHRPPRRHRGCAPDDTGGVEVRRERVGDVGAVRRVHAAAFARMGAEGGEPVEVALVAALRASAAWIPRLSLVACCEHEVVGHVVCTRAEVGVDRRPVLGLGPLGVLPARQGRGVGTALVHAVLGAAEALDEPLVGLLGEPSYYRRFGFAPARDHGIDPPDPAWGDHFQVRRLTLAENLVGLFRYAPPFSSLPSG